MAPTPTPACVTAASTTAASEPAPVSATKTGAPCGKASRNASGHSPTLADSTAGQSSPPNLFEDATGALVTGPSYENTVTDSMPMGYEPESYCSPESQGVSFSGSPRRQRKSGCGDPPPAAGTGATTATTTTSSGGRPLEFLQNQPLFPQRRQILPVNPSLLPASLQQLGGEKSSVTAANEPIPGAFDPDVNRIHSRSWWSRRRGWRWR